MNWTKSTIWLPIGTEMTWIVRDLIMNLIRIVTISWHRIENDLSFEIVSRNKWNGMKQCYRFRFAVSWFFFFFIMKSFRWSFGAKRVYAIHYAQFLSAAWYIFFVIPPAKVIFVISVDGFLFLSVSQHFNCNWHSVKLALLPFQLNRFFLHKSSWHHLNYL